MTTTRNRTLLLITSDSAEDSMSAVEGRAPRRDYAELAAALGADILDVASIRRGRVGRLLMRVIGRGPAHAVLAYPRLRHYDVVFSDNEHVGLFMGTLL